MKWRPCARKELSKLFGEWLLTRVMSDHVLYNFVVSSKIAVKHFIGDSEKQKLRVQRFLDKKKFG